MTDLARYEALLADWREKEEHATRMREFRDTGGVHHLTIAVVRADPILAAVVGPAINGIMKAHGWQTLVDQTVKRAEYEARLAQEKLENCARDAVIARSMA